MREQRQRIEPKHKPEIRAEIKKVDVIRYRRPTRVWGVEFTIDGDVIPVHFGSKHEAMIYICTLLRAKMGERLYRYEFFNIENQGKYGSFRRKESREWIEEVYRKLGYLDFDQWMQSLAQRALNQGKSNGNKLIDNALLGKRSNATYYCIIHTDTDRNDDSYFEIKLDPQEIIIPDDWHALIDSFYHLYPARREMIQE